MAIIQEKVSMNNAKNTSLILKYQYNTDNNSGRFYGDKVGENFLS